MKEYLSTMQGGTFINLVAFKKAGLWQKVAIYNVLYIITQDSVNVHTPV